MNLSPATLDALVSTLLLQHPRGNAIRHGVSKTSAAVRIEVKSNLRDSILEIQVCDDRPGFSGESLGRQIKRCWRLGGPMATWAYVLLTGATSDL
jgi:LytS/YehU family sensor histidine kinase